MHDGTAALHRNLKLAGILHASGIGHDRSSEHRQFVVTNLIKIANRSVYHNALQSLEPSPERGDFAPQSCIEFSLSIDYQDTASRTMGQSNPDHGDVRPVDAHGHAGPAIRQLAERHCMS